MYDFFYECEICKTTIPTLFANPILPPWQVVRKASGIKVELTFRCQDHAVVTPDENVNGSLSPLDNQSRNP
jgi:hypothetical protein